MVEFAKQGDSSVLSRRRTWPMASICHSSDSCRR